MSRSRQKLAAACQTSATCSVGELRASRHMSPGQGKCRTGCGSSEQPADSWQPAYIGQQVLQRRSETCTLQSACQNSPPATCYSPPACSPNACSLPQHERKCVSAQAAPNKQTAHLEVCADGCTLKHRLAGVGVLQVRHLFAASRKEHRHKDQQRMGDALEGAAGGDTSS